MNEIEVLKDSQSDIVNLQAKSYDDLLERFFLERELSDSSIETYKGNLSQFRKWLQISGRENKFKLRRLTKFDLIDFKTFLKKDLKLNSRSINSYLVSVRQFFKFLVSYQLYPINPVDNIKSEKVGIGHSKDDLSLSQVREILDIMNDESVIESRDKAINILKYFTGLRDIEVVRACIEDIRSKSGKFVLHVQGKGRKESDKDIEFVILNEMVYRSILDYLSKTNRTLKDSGALFLSHSDRNNGKRITTKTVQRAVIKPIVKLNYKTDRITSHSTRHTAINLAYEAGATLEELQVMARHRDSKTTQIYLKSKNRLQSNAESKLFKFFSKNQKQKETLFK